MSINPGTFNITLYRRSDWIQPIVLKDSTGSAVNLSGYTASSQIWNQERTKKHVDITCTITNTSTGAITLSLTDTQTSILPKTAYYDLKLTTGSNSDFWLTGKITANEGYTS
tara:strand:+ start:112 stop:447 length:336 start_codon:yes stop_codon:yes gene_type:complete